MLLAVRRATDADASRLDELAAAAIAEQVDARGGSVWSRREAARVPDDATAFVGTIDDAVIGYAHVSVDTLDDGARLGVVHAIYVEPEGREVGLGEALLDTLIAWCAERECVGIDAHALPGNRTTKNFFETFGFTARLLVVHRKL